MKQALYLIAQATALQWSMEQQSCEYLSKCSISYNGLKKSCIRYGMRYGF